MENTNTISSLFGKLRMPHFLRKKEELFRPVRSYMLSTKYLTIALFLLVLIAAQPGKEFEMSTKIEIEAMVIKYIANAMSDEYDSGAFAVYDATVLSIVFPVELKDTEITIYHSKSVPADSLWREIARKLRFSLEENLVEGKNFLFDGAIENLRTVVN